MRYLRDAESIPYPGIRALVRQRIAELSQDDLFDPATMGSLILVEPGDTASLLEKECGCLITTGLFGDAKFGDPEFMPCFEWWLSSPQRPHSLASQHSKQTRHEDGFEYGCNR